MSEVREGYFAWIWEPERARSGEVDFGCWWMLAPDRPFPRWGVSWIEATGELYARDLGTDRYIVLGQHGSREEVEEAMSGWAGGAVKSLSEWFGVPVANE